MFYKFDVFEHGIVEQAQTHHPPLFSSLVSTPNDHNLVALSSMQSYVDGDILSAIDLFIRAVDLAKENGVVPVKTLARLEKRVNSDRYAVNDSMLFTRLLPQEPIGYVRWALYLIKYDMNDLEALELLLTASELEPHPNESDDELRRKWVSINTIINHYLGDLKLKTGYDKRRDPCKVFPLEVLNQIFSLLNMKAWLGLQIVSKSWREYLINDPYLWASSIDFSCFEKRKCSDATVKQCLDLAFVKSRSPLQLNHVPSIQYLQIGPFSTLSAETDCLILLSKDRFIYQGKTIDKLSIEFRKLPKGQDVSENHPVYSLVPTGILLLSTNYPTNLGSVYLDRLLLNQNEVLEELHLSCRKVLSKYDGLVTEAPLERIKYPSLKVLNLNTCDVSELSYLIFFDCPNLQTLTLATSSYFDIEWFCKAKLFSLKSLHVSFSKDHSKSGHSGRVVFGGLYHPLHMPRDYVAEWPTSLTSLTLYRVEWSLMQSVSGSLEGLQMLNLGHSKIDIKEFFNRYKCGDNLIRLILEYTVLNDDYITIWEKCPNIRHLSLFKSTKLNDAHINNIINHCTNLEEIDLGRTGVSDTTIEKLSALVKTIGCKSIKFRPGMFEKIKAHVQLVVNELN